MKLVDVVEKIDTRGKVANATRRNQWYHELSPKRSDLHSNGSDSPQVQKPLSTDNDKGGSLLNPPKSAINLVPKKDVPEGDPTISWDSKDYH